MTSTAYTGVSTLPTPATTVGTLQLPTSPKAPSGYDSTYDESTFNQGNFVPAVAMAGLMIVLVGCGIAVILQLGGGPNSATVTTEPDEHLKVFVKIPALEGDRKKPFYTEAEEPTTPYFQPDTTSSDVFDVRFSTKITYEEITTPAVEQDSPTPAPPSEDITLGSPPSSHKRNHYNTTPLVCVYGNGINTTMVFPEEGICKLTMFDSLYKEGKNPWNSPQSELQLFLKHARNYSTSQFGCSFDFQNRRELAQALKDQNARKFVDKYWDDNIHHYGMLDISPYKETEANVLNAVKLFQHLYPLLESRSGNSGASTLIVFGFSPISEKWISFVPSLFKEFRPDIFIFRGHYSLINDDKPNCMILPVTVMDDMPEVPFTLATAHNAVKKLAGIDGGKTSLAVSLSMAGRWNRPVNYSRKNSADYVPFKACTKLPKGIGQFGSILETCVDREFRLPILRGTVYRDEYKYSFHKGLSMIYETDDSLKYKLCSLKETMTEVSYGVAVFDMEYDDWSDKCYINSFQRLRVLQRVTEFFDSPEAFQFEPCTNL